MNEPAPPIAPLLVALVGVGLGVYVLFGALALEVYALVPVAVVCMAVGFAPGLKLLRPRR